MKRLYYGLGLVAGLLVTVVFAVYVWHALRGHNLAVYGNPRSAAGIVIAALVYCCGVPLNALAWQGLLRGVGTRKSWRELTGILGTSQIAKYIPGNVGQYIGRAAMSVKRGIGARAFTVTVVMEILLTVTAALCVGICTGALSDAGRAMVRTKRLQLLIVAAVVALAAIGVLTFKQFAPGLLRRFVPAKAHILEGQLLPEKSFVIRAFSLYCAGALINGVALIILAHLLLPDSPHEDWLLLASFALAWVVGFATPGAPAGLGVREGLLLLMLGPTYGVAAAGVLIIALRIVTTLGDLLWGIGGWPLLPRRPATFETGASAGH